MKKNLTKKELKELAVKVNDHLISDNVVMSLSKKEQYTIYEYLDKNSSIANWLRNEDPQIDLDYYIMEEISRQCDED